MKEKGCLLEHRNERLCAAGKCERCGWNRDVQKEREQRIKEAGLTETDGVRKLILGKKETAYELEGRKAYDHVCEYCGTAFQSKTKKGKYCCRECSTRAQNERRKENRN